MTSAILFSILALALGYKFEFLQNFGVWEYIMLFAIGFLDVSGFLLNAKAVFLDNPGKISIYRYLGAVINLILDITVFGTKFFLI